MRFPKVVPRPGTKKVVNKFLFLPLKIDNQTRWLERADIVMVWREETSVDSQWFYHSWYESEKQLETPEVRSLLNEANYLGNQLVALEIRLNKLLMQQQGNALKNSRNIG